VFAGRPEIVTEIPDPVVVILSGVRNNIQLPVDGNPFNVTLPVASEHVGWVIVPTIGADGTIRDALILTVDEFPEVHPEEFVTVYI
jgi:hypothetical protein